MTRTTPEADIRQRCIPRSTLNQRWSALASPSARAILNDEFPKESADTYARNIENFIGEARMPIGVAGPLRVLGPSEARDYFVPLATTEATLVASYARGARLITAAGGCTAVVVKASISRAPGFVFESVTEAVQFATWADSRMDAFRAVTETTSRFARLISLRPIVEANHVYLILDFHTGDAAGQNMVTVATQAIVENILRDCPTLPARTYVEANLSGDKKACVQSTLLGRGRWTTADVTISRELLQSRLRVTPEMMVNYFQVSSVGAVLSGAIGLQGHCANGLTALFIACGQDVACVAESAVGITRCEVRPDGSLYASVTLPSLAVGTVGGGTSLPTQRACLDLLRLDYENQPANEFATICAALALAGELSIAGAIAANEFTQAHVALGRRGR